MNMQQAQRVYDHLMRTGQAFCFTEYGIVSREDCQRILFGENLQKEVNREARAQ